MKKKRKTKNSRMFWFILLSYFLLQFVILAVLQDKSMVFLIYIIIFPIGIPVIPLSLRDPKEKIFKYLKSKSGDDMYLKLFYELYPLGIAAGVQPISNFYKFLTLKGITDEKLLNLSKQNQLVRKYIGLYILFSIGWLIILYFLFKGSIYL